MQIFESLRRWSSRGNLLPCPLCRTGNGGGINDFCPACMERFPWITGSRCPGCGGTLDGILGQCSKCLREPQRPWLYALALMDYRTCAREMVHDLKFHNRPELARPLGKIAAQQLLQCGEPADLIVPVPLHWSRYWTRTYNQSQLFAAECARHSQIPCANLLRRVRRTPHQAALKRKDRLKNLRNAFAVSDPSQIAGKNVWLTDDVLTTGATLEEAAKTLLKNGALTVRILVIARS